MIRIHGQKNASKITQYLNGRNYMVQIFINVRNGCIGYTMHPKTVSWKDYPDTSDVKTLFFTAYPLTIKDIRYKAEQCLADLGIR